MDSQNSGGIDSSRSIQYRKVLQRQLTKSEKASSKVLNLNSNHLSNKRVGKTHLPFYDELSFRIY
jgi:hypothetical protein